MPAIFPVQFTTNRNQYIATMNTSIRNLATSNRSNPYIIDRGEGNRSNPYIIDRGEGN